LIRRSGLSGHVVDAHEKLTITLSYTKDKPKQATLQIGWGKLRLAAPVEITVLAAKTTAEAWILHIGATSQNGTSWESAPKIGFDANSVIE
jgi:hypothetical protein